MQELTFAKSDFINSRSGYMYRDSKFSECLCGDEPNAPDNKRQQVPINLACTYRSILLCRLRKAGSFPTNSEFANHGTLESGVWRVGDMMEIDGDWILWTLGLFRKQLRRRPYSVVHSMH